MSPGGLARLAFRACTAERVGKETGKGAPSFGTLHP